MSGAFVLAVFLTIISMATKILIIGPILQILIIIGIVWFLFEFYKQYQIVSQEGYNHK